MKSTGKYQHITNSDAAYAIFERMIADRISSVPASETLYRTTVDPQALWGAYIMGIPQSERQHYNCRCCQAFIQKYGGLIRIDEHGRRSALLWSGPEDVPGFFFASVSALNTLIEESAIEGVFYDEEPVWGQPANFDKKRLKTWSHLHGRPNSYWQNKLKTASQAMAEKSEEHGMLLRGLDEYPLRIVDEAARVLKSGAMYRSEKATGFIEWLQSVHEAAVVGNSKARLWRAVVMAPTGFCHVKTNVTATLMDDLKHREGLMSEVRPSEYTKRKLANDYSFEAISKRWAEKLNPLQYQRPQAPPAAGNIAQAEKIVGKLGIERSLERRYATLTDVRRYNGILWEPAANRPEPPAGVFGHLKPKAAQPSKLILPAKKMTWERFESEVLHTADTMEVKLPATGQFYGLLTATHDDAPNLMQWPNPVSWYVWASPTSPGKWGLHGEYAKVNAVFLGPYDWQERGKFAHQGKRAMFALEGCREDAYSRPGLGLFPEILKNELREVRSTIEAHSRSRQPTGRENGDANGILFVDGGQEVEVRVNGTDSYIIDRWS